MPRPTRLRDLRGAAGFRFERLSSSGTRLRLLHSDEVADFPQHTRELRALRALDRAADLAEPERPQRAAMTRGVPDLATRLRDLQLRHPSTPGPGPVAPLPGCRPAWVRA